jgi:hypothetical protein
VAFRHSLNSHRTRLLPVLCFVSVSASVSVPVTVSVSVTVFALCLVQGEHTIRLLLRHDSLDYLDKLKATCCVITRKLDTPLSLPVHSSYAAAVGAPPAPGGGGGGGNGVGDMFLGAGARAALWVAPPADDKLPKDATAGRPWGDVCSSIVSCCSRCFERALP